MFKVMPRSTQSAQQTNVNSNENPPVQSEKLIKLMKTRQDLMTSLSRPNSLGNFHSKTRDLENVTQKIKQEEKRLSDLDNKVENSDFGLSHTTQPPAPAVQNQPALIGSLKDFTDLHEEEDSSSIIKDSKLEETPPIDSSGSTQQQASTNESSTSNIKDSKREENPPIDSSHVQSEIPSLSQQFTPVATKWVKALPRKEQFIHPMEGNKEEDATQTNLIRDSKTSPKNDHVPLSNNKKQDEKKESGVTKSETYDTLVKRVSSLEEKLEETRRKAEESKQFRDTTIRVMKWVGGILFVSAVAVGGYWIWKRYGLKAPTPTLPQLPNTKGGGACACPGFVETATGKAVDLCKALVPISIDKLTVTWKDLTEACNRSHKAMTCSTGMREWTMNWVSPAGVTEHLIYQNGTLVSKLGADVLSYTFQSKSDASILIQIVAIGAAGTQSIPVIFKS